MGNTCTSAKTDATIKKSDEPSNATISQLPPIDNRTAKTTVPEEVPSTPKNSSEEAPSASPVELQSLEADSTKRMEEND